jgi:dolichol-phosphate mannosyltransferase
MNRVALSTNSQSKDLLTVPQGPLAVPAQTLSKGAGSEERVLLTLVVPTYKEAKNVERLTKQLDDNLSAILPGQYEIIIVDDNSPDETWKVAQSLTAVYPRLRVMRRIDERGLSTAVVRGWQAAKGEVLGVIDGDLQHPPEILQPLWGKIQEGAELAVASRHVTGGGVSDWSLARRILSRGAQVIGLVILPEVVGRVSDPMSGFFLLRRGAIAGKSLSPVGYKILIEVLGRGDFGRIGEVGYVFQERELGESKVSGTQYVQYLKHLLTLRFALVPFRRFLRFGVVGLSGTFVDMGLFYLLRHSLPLNVVLCAGLSAEVAIINNFLWNERWTFRDFSGSQTGPRQRFIRLVKFNAICVVGLFFHLLILSALMNFFGTNEYVAKTIAIGLVTVWNYWINVNLNWRVTAVS